jgi:hypothetical protein
MPVKEITLARQAPKEVVFSGSAQVKATEIGQEALPGLQRVDQPVSLQRSAVRPRTSIVLSKAKPQLSARERKAPEIPSLGNAAVRSKGAIALSKLKAAPALWGQEESVVCSVRLYDCGQGIFSIRAASSLVSNPPASEMVSHLWP